MFTTSLDLAQLSDIAAEMTIAETDDLGPMIAHAGTHPSLGDCVLSQCEDRGLLVSAKPYRPAGRH